jgi:hypothetical protein
MLNKIVKITLVDILTESPWKTMEQVLNYEPAEITSYGRLVHEDNKIVIVAGMVGLDDCISMFQVIPKGCILKIEEV